jgi:uncharacterized MAPEG superfamily protein
MTIDASLLVLAVIVFIVQVMVQGLFSNLEHKPKDMLGARDALSDGKLAARAKRANQNMIEALWMFAPLMLVAILMDRTNDMTALGGWLFVAGRAAYAPIYWLGVPLLRTVAWVVALAGVVLVLLHVLPFSGAA